MKALGWSEQLLAVEWNKIDLAVFQATPRTPDKCALLCEAKSLGHGLQNVVKSRQVSKGGHARACFEIHRELHLGDSFEAVER